MLKYCVTEPGEELHLIQAPNGVALSKDIAASYPGKINAYINCSTFVMSTGDCLGRNQGDKRNDAPDVKEFYSLCIYKDGSFKCGNFQSWDYRENVTAGFGVQAVLIEDGKIVNKLSSDIGITKQRIVTKNYNIFVGRTKDKKWYFYYTDQSAEWLENNLLVPNFEILCLLDGGGSCDFMLNGKKIITSSRKLPNILAITPGTQEEPHQEEPKVHNIYELEKISEELDGIIDSLETTRDKLKNALK